VVLDVLGDAVDLVLGLMDLDLRVSTGYGVDLTTLLLFFEYGSLPHTDRQLT